MLPHCWTSFLKYPKLLRKEASVHIIQSRDHILNTYSEAISKYAEERFDRHGIHTIINARVKEVGKDYVTYTVKKDGAKPEEFTVPSGFTLWSTGIGEFLPTLWSSRTSLVLVLNYIPPFLLLSDSHEPFHTTCSFATTQSIS